MGVPWLKNLGNFLGNVGSEKSSEAGGRSQLWVGGGKEREETWGRLDMV